MKNNYFLTLVTAIGMTSLTLAQSPNSNVLQAMAKDTSVLKEPPGKQVNVALPATDGISVDATSTMLPYYGYSISGSGKAYHLFNGNTNQFEYHQSSDVTPDFYINGSSKAGFNTSFFGIGTSFPTTAFTGFTMKSAVNDWYGMYVDAGTTGKPFYGYALNGTARAYTSFNSSTNQFEYHQTSDGIPDFYINGNTKAVFNTSFLGIGAESPTTGFTGFSLKSNVNSWYGMYVDAGATGLPFYGYALNGTPVAYTQYNGTTNQLEYYHSNGSVPDFLMSSTIAAYPATTFLGIGTTTPTTAFTGMALKNSIDNFWGMYIDAGVTGQPFYGYALNGTPKAYTQFNGSNNQFEYHQTSDATPDFYVNGNSKAVFNTSFFGINTGTPTTIGATGFAMKSSVNGYYGMYVDAGATGLPFYGYALNGIAKAWTQLNGGNNNWELVYNVTAISVNPTGNVGIGTGTPTQKLDVNGTIHASNLNGGATSLSTDASGNIIRTPSDANLKCQIASIDNPLEKVMQMHGVSYNFIDSERFGSDRQMGFLAQDLEKVIPETVSSGGEYKSVNYQEITALLTEAMKEQQKIIDQLKERIEILEENKK
jgi:hypothetical protein